MKLQLRKTIAEAISQQTTIPFEEISLEAPKKKAFGDLAFPCFQLAKLWKKSPPECAVQLAEAIKLPPGVLEANPTGPFLNFRFDRTLFSTSVVREALEGSTKIAKLNKTVVVEYSSPNIAKPFHVGHLRATLIGNCLDRLYRHLCWNTHSVNHLGDWGTQFGFVWAGCELWGKPENDSVLGLLETYRKATGLKSEQEERGVADGEKDINEMARQYFIDLESGEAYAVDFWKWCSKISLAYFKQTYDRLGVSFDHYTGESFYSDKLDDVRNDLEQAGILQESDKALGVDLGEKLGFARVFTADGRSLYLTRDIATAKYRAETFQFDRAVYVVGAPQTLHFQQIKGILRELGRDYADKIIHVPFGHVMGIKTRGEGQFVELNEFFDEAYQRALDAYHTQVSKRPENLDEKEVARAVALAAILFSNLSRTNIKDVHFDWDSALTFQGDSGPYLLYAYARINGIKEKAAAHGVLPDTEFSKHALSEEAAFQVASLLADFEQVVERAVEEHEPYLLANYALELAKSISKAYLDLKVVGVENDLAVARLTLFEASRVILGKSLELLGIQPLERM